MDPMEHPELEKVAKQIAAKCKGLPLALKTLAEQRGDERIQDLGNQYFNDLRSRSLFERVRNPFHGNIEEFLMHDLVNDLALIASSKFCVRLEECQESHMLDQSHHMSYSMGKGGDFEKLTPVKKLEQLRTLLPVNIQHNSVIFHNIKISLRNRVLHNILPSLRSLRALSLSGYGIVEMPNDLFIRLKLLRFLDLSRTDTKKLPDSICALYNLETLLLSSCDDLEELPPQMEKLIKLRHLDISDTSHLKRPLHLSKLKSLQLLVGAEFLLGDPCGWRMEDLGDLHNLYGSLSILELQNLVDKREAPKAKIREKEHVEKLSLRWSGSNADNSQTERGILDELHPHSNIKELKISGYRGTQFPNWLADHLFLKLLLRLSLSKCKDCFSLPALGQPPSLKFLSIREMLRITEDLFIYDCPKLVGKFPENLCSLTKLRISRCPELNLETPIQLSSLKSFEVDGSPKAGVFFDEAQLLTSQLEVLDIRDCKSLTALPISTLPSTLKTISVYHCRKLELEAPDSSKMNSNMFLEELRLDECDSISSPDLVPRARYFSIQSDEEIVSGENWELPCSIQSLFIENLKTLSSQVLNSLTSLESLRTFNLPQVQSLLEEGLPFSLSELYLSDHDELHSLPAEGLGQLTSLQRLDISNCLNLQSLPESALPSSLSELTIEDFPNLQSLPVKGMPSSLSKLYISCCPLLKPLLEFDKGSTGQKLLIFLKYT
ncbi:hypothetical protein BC332_29170 [Capsicum chinense]|nr:hypothetical protein BC332_29170 [Capsicum chinense]